MMATPEKDVAAEPEEYPNGEPLKASQIERDRT